MKIIKIMKIMKPVDQIVRMNIIIVILEIIILGTR